MPTKRPVAVATALLAAGFTLAVSDTNTAVFGADNLPSLAPAKPVNLPPIVERTLPNGLRIVLLEDHLQPSLSVRLAIPAGSVRDSREKVGLAGATAELLDKGTTTRTETQIADTIDALGASLSASADSDYLFVSASGLSSYANTLFELMADITLRPTFPADEWERLRTRTLSGITADLGSPESVAGSVLSRRVFGSHPYGNYDSGTPETLAVITPTDFRNFHTQYFVPNGSVLFLVGDISAAEATVLASKYFAGWQSRNTLPAPKPPVPVAQTKNRVTIINKPGTEQTQIRIGSMIGSYADPDRTVVNVGNAVLGGGGFEGRLVKEIRVKRGLTYGANSGFSRSKDAGIFTISTFTKPASTGETVEIALAEAAKLAKDGPTETELGERKTYLSGSFAVGVATAQGVLGRIVPAILYGTGAGEVEEYVGKVEATTPDSVRDALAKALPQNGVGYEIVAVGDAKAIQPQLAKFGDVTVIESDDLDLNAPDLTKPQAAAPKTATPDTAAAFGESDEARSVGAKLLADAIAAHGGAAFTGIKTLIITGKGEFIAPPQAGNLLIPLDSLTLTTASGGRSRLAAASGFGDLLFVARGEGKGGFVVTPGGQPQELPAGRIPNVEPTAFLRAAVEKKYAVAGIMDDTVEKGSDGKTLIPLDIRSDKGDVTRVYLEEGTKRVRKIVAKGQGGKPAVVLLSNYTKPVSGVLLPGSVQIQQDGADVFRLTFDKIVVNAPVADALFEKP
ncbi:MAG: insulinase family protein [Armatimonadetes bacterium]|nr:insulinase family protein [Armatimonadota bacterium]